MILTHQEWRETYALMADLLELLEEQDPYPTSDEHPIHKLRDWFGWAMTPSSVTETERLVHILDQED